MDESIYPLLVNVSASGLLTIEKIGVRCGVVHGASPSFKMSVKLIEE